MIPIPGNNLTLKHDSGSQFNVECRPGVIIRRGIKTQGHNSTLNHEPGSNFNVESWLGPQFHVESWPGVTFQRGIMTRDHNSTRNYDSGSKFNVELWPRVRITLWIMIPIPGHNLPLIHDPGSKFNVELRPGVIIFLRRRGGNTMTPCLGGSQFNMKNPLNPEHIPLNQDPTGRNSMGSKFNPTSADL